MSKGMEITNLALSNNTYKVNLWGYKEAGLAFSSAVYTVNKWKYKNKQTSLKHCSW